MTTRKDIGQRTDYDTPERDAANAKGEAEREAKAAEVKDVRAIILDKQQGK